MGGLSALRRSLNRRCRARDRFEQTPVVVLACIERWRRPHISEGGSVYPACQNLLLAARALGYGGVLEGDVLVCQFHGHRIGLGAPAREGYCVRAYRTVSAAGAIFRGLPAQKMNPTAVAPSAAAILASSARVMPQIFTIMPALHCRPARVGLRQDRARP